MNKALCKKPFLLLSMLTFSLCLALAPCQTLALSQEDAQRLVKDTKTIDSYLELKGESDYVGKPQNILMAALFGAYDAKMAFAFEQAQRKEEGKKALPANTALFTVNGRSLPANQVLMRDEAPAVFKNLSENFTCFITRDAAALAALYFTGHSVQKHSAPKNAEFLGQTLLNDQGYFVSIDGLGDAPTEAVLQNMTVKGDGFVLTGEVIQVLGDPDEQQKPGSFRLELTPGDVPGCWKRQYSEKAPK
ncbi:MAG: hypothetical protein K6G15_11925 [Desulfovibrio sp.]|nr:hypothetical protein [Desulfovibrio sp.]